MDGETRAELLSFLVVGELLAYARSGAWLRTDHLIESCQMWLSSNGARCDWLERAKLIDIAQELAQDVHALPLPHDEADLIKLFNLEGGWFLDYRSPIVRQIHTLSLARLGVAGEP
ncbi:hypothetical protein [Paraburkholderia sp. J67]|uniref:hypothetical protein n=1 Tax=Paraburkholderia sp. J67 TaxID=2805435 RepID=UPI002ABDBC36|nr:hypothetical protein [Paraburkholderia sp. J67]